MSARPHTYKRLPIKKKLEILKEADEIKNDREVGRRHKVDPATIRGWRKQKDKLAEVFSSEKGPNLKNVGREMGSDMFPEMEIILDAWIREARSLGLCVTQRTMCKMALQFLEDLGIPHEGFKASVGWVRRFVKRKGLACRRVSTLNQHNPDDIN